MRSGSLAVIACLNMTVAASLDTGPEYVLTTPRPSSGVASANGPLTSLPGLAPVSATVRVASPAVGFFVYADGLGPGLAVAKGDSVGHVEMLGVRHDVRAPRGGTVRNLVAESGEAVEYGQVVVELQAAEAGR